MKDRFSAAYQVLNEAIRERAFPGCAFGVLSAGEVVLIDALGQFTYEPDSPFVEPETIFDIASITKVAATTAAAMLLYQRGILNLETPVGDLLPGFLKGRESVQSARRVTLRHLLAHSSGLPGYREIFRTAQTPEAVYQACLELPIEAEPGTRMEYSDPGFILLGKALEAIIGEPLDRWVQREVLTPLGMTATVYCPAPQIRMQIPPTEIDTTLRHRTIQGEVQDEHAYLLGGVAGHAGLFSNVADLLRFSLAILEAKPACEAASLVHIETVNQFAERQQPAGSSRALGWDTPSGDSSSGKYFSPHSIGHLGYSGCSLWIDREAEVTVVLLSNRTWPDRSTDKIKMVRPRFHNTIREALPV